MGAVAAGSIPSTLHRAHGLVAPGRRRLRRRAGRRRASASSGCRRPVLSSRPRPRPAASGRWPPRSAPRSSSSTRPCRSAWSAPAWVCPTPSCCTAPRSTVPGRLPGPRQALARVLDRRPVVVVGRRLPGGRGPPGRRLGRCRRSSRSRPGSTSTGSATSPTRSGPGPGRPGLPADGPLVVSVSRLVPRKGMDVLIAGAPPPGAVVPGPDRGHRRRRAATRGRLADRSGRPGPRSGCSAGSTTTTCPALLGAADVFAMACRNRWLRPRAGGIRDRLPGGGGGRGAPGGRAQRRRRRGGVDGETGLVVADPADAGAVAHALRRSWPTATCAGGWAGPPGPGGGILRLRSSHLGWPSALQDVEG